MIADKHTAQTIAIGDNEAPIWIYGNTSKPVILFIHGYYHAFSDYVGDLPMRHLMDRYCIVAFDLPGYGVSKNLAVDAVSFIKAVVRHIANGRKVVLFGTSFGGVVALRYAASNANDIAAVIVSGTPCYSTPLNWPTVLRVLPKKKKSNMATMVAGFRFMRKRNLSQIQLPVLLHYSSNDKRAPVAMGKKLQQILPNAQLFTVTDRTHEWLLHRIDENGFLLKATQFIDRYAGA